MLTTYVRHTVQWWTDGVVRQICGVLLLSPLLIAAVWAYGHLLYWLAMAIGIPPGGAVGVASFMTIFSCLGVGALVLVAMTSHDR